MRAITQKLFHSTLYDREMLQENSRTILMVVGGMYITFHCVATLGWPRVFNPPIWLVTVGMLVLLAVCLYLLPRLFALAQVLWYIGLVGLFLLAFRTFGYPEILLGLAILPLMAVMMVGFAWSCVLEAFLLGVFSLAPAWNWLPAIPAGLPLVGMLISICMLGLGWALSLNLLKAVESANYHYNEARANLEEAREHRAKISVLLDNINRSNYQLDRLNQMLSYARAKTDEAYEERNRFAMAVSHELRSPLNFIIGFSDLMVNTPQMYAPEQEWPPGLYDDINQVYRSSNHLLALINDILEMGKIDARQMVLFREWVNVNDLVQEVRAMVEGSLKSKQLWLKTEVDSNLPDLYIDRTRIRQVLINFVTNSLNFTKAGGITIRARLSEPACVRLEVEDTGAGIAEGDIPKLFQEFRQVGKQTWRRTEGSGLGLAIGKRFIDLHNGEMGVTSQVGKGSQFFFTLPVSDPSVEMLELPELPLESEANPPPEKREPLLLFLTEDPFWARIFGEAIAGYKVALVEDPAQLLPTVMRLYPRGILLDATLPDNPHVDAFLANPPYDLPVIRLKIPVNLNRVTRLPEGVLRYLVKPVPRQVLYKAFRDAGEQVSSVLVVDDDPSMVRFVEQSLRSLEDAGGLNGDMKILSAATGLEALRVMHAEQVDLLLLDIDLPEMDGLRVMEEMRQHPVMSKIPVIIVSANDLPQHLSPERYDLFEVRSQHHFSTGELTALLEAALKVVQTEYARQDEDETSQM